MTGNLDLVFILCSQVGFGEKTVWFLHSPKQNKGFVFFTTNEAKAFLKNDRKWKDLGRYFDNVRSKAKFKTFGHFSQRHRGTHGECGLKNGLCASSVVRSSCSSGCN